MKNNGMCDVVGVVLAFDSYDIDTVTSAINDLEKEGRVVRHYDGRNVYTLCVAYGG